MPGWVGLTLGVTFGCGYVFIITCLAGALLPYRAKDVYEASPGAKYTVNGLVALLFTLLGVVAFIWTAWVSGPAGVRQRRPDLARAPGRHRRRGRLPVPDAHPHHGLAQGREGAVALGAGHDRRRLRHGHGRRLPARSGAGRALGNWNFKDFPRGLWAQIIAFGIIILFAVWYLVVKNRQKTRGINVDFAFKEIPPE